MLFQTTRAPFFAHQKKHSIFANFLKTGLASTLILTGACSAAHAAGIELGGGGPTELTSRVEADVSEDVSVFWNNDISDAAQQQLKAEETSELKELQALYAKYDWYDGREGTETNTMQTAMRSDVDSDYKDSDVDKSASLMAEMFRCAGDDLCEDSTYKELMGAALEDSFSVELLSILIRTVPLDAGYRDFIERTGGTRDAMREALVQERIDVALEAYSESNTDRMAELLARLDDPELYDTGITKSGLGTLILQGVNTYTGETRVEGGLLVLEGPQLDVRGQQMLDADGKAIIPSLQSPVIVSAGSEFRADGLVHNLVTVDGLLSGTGTIDDLWVRSGGYVSPGGTDLGSLHVNNNVTFESGSVFDVEIMPDFSGSDQLAIGGTAILLGGAVHVNLVGTTHFLTEDVTQSLFLKRFDILTAAEGITGQFEGVFPRYNYITPILDYSDKNKVVLSFDFTPEIKAVKLAEAERIRLAAEAAEKARLEAIEIARLAAEAEAKRLAELEAKRLADAEAERIRLAAEAAEKARLEAIEIARLAAEAETKRLAELEAKRLADAEAERIRLAAEAAEKARLEAIEIARLAAEAEAKRLAELEAKRLADAEAERIRLVAEAAEKARLEAIEVARLAAEAEAKRLAELEAKRLADAEAERIRLAAEAAEKARLEAIEVARLADAEAEAKRLAELEAKRLADAEAERIRLAAEAAEKARLEAIEIARLAAEAETKRLAELEAKRLADAEAERIKLVAEAAEKARLEAIEIARVAAEAEAKRLADLEAKRLADAEAERIRLAAETAEKERLVAEGIEAARLAAEAEAKRLAELEAKRLADAEAERIRLAAEAAEKARLEAIEIARLAAEAEAKRLAELEAKRLADAEAERIRLVAEAAEKARLEAIEVARLAAEAETKRLADLEAKRLADAEAERIRLAAEAAEKARLEAIEVARVAAEAEAKRLAELEAKRFADAEAERIRLAAETAEKARLEAIEIARVAAEAETKRLADLEAKRLADDAEQVRLAAEAEEKRLAELEAKRLADAEAEKARVAAKIKRFLSDDVVIVGVTTANQKSVWKGIQSLGAAKNPLLSQVLFSTVDDPLNFDALSGEVHATLAGVLANDSHFISDAATARVRDAFDGVAGKAISTVKVDPLTALWGEVYGSWAHADGDGAAAGYSRDTGGIVTGMDGIVADDWRFGLLAAYGNTSLHGNGKATVDSYQLGLYGGTRWDALGLRMGVNLGHHEIETKRTAFFGSLNNEHEADYSASSVQVFGELGYEIDTAYAALEPFAAARYVHVKTDGFSEDGDISNLTASSTSTDLTVTTLGLRASHQFSLSQGTTLTARGMLGWNHAFGDVTPESRLAFTGGDGFTVQGLAIAEDVAIVEAGFDIGLGKATTIGFAYTGQFSSQAHDNAIKADLSVRF